MVPAQLARTLGPCAHLAAPQARSPLKEPARGLSSTFSDPGHHPRRVLWGTLSQKADPNHLRNRLKASKGILRPSPLSHQSIQCVCCISSPFSLSITGCSREAPGHPLK